MLAKINKLKNWQVALFIAILGFAIYSTGLNNQFQGDDSLQIINNIPVHSISNVKLFFEGGTFYNGQGLAPLSGSYFRPLMTTTYSIIYSLFGPNVTAYHVIQLLICILSAFILFLFFKYSFKTVLALTLALIFLVHPLNSQVVFDIPSMPDVLFFLFGILALWLLLRFKSIKSLWIVAISLFLSMLSKEAAIVFIAVSLLYLFWFNRERIKAFIGIILVPISLYLVLRINAIGLFPHSSVAPIDYTNLAGRLVNIPSVILFYLSKFIFPWRLAHSYYWVNSHISIRHFFIPLMIDLIVFTLIVYLALLIRKKLSKKKYYTYLFFTIWMLLGLVTCLQIIPLDMTACEAWFYFSMAGLLGMIGITLGMFRIRLTWFLVIAALIIGILGVRTVIRGLDWKNAYTLAFKDIATSPSNYIADKNIAIYYFNQGEYIESKEYATRSINLFPNALSYNTLGQDLTLIGNYPGAVRAFTIGMKYQELNVLYDNRAALTAGYGAPVANTQFLISAVKIFPQDANIWLYLAIQEYKDNDSTDAKFAITQSYKYGQPNETIAIIYERIMSNLPLNVKYNPSSNSK